MLKFAYASLAAIAVAVAAPASAAVITNLSSPVPAGTSWGIVPGENTGTVAITTTAPRSGTGSLELTGDRTRVQTGVQYAPFTTNIGSTNAVTGLTFDWQVASNSSNQILTPALRLLVQDGSQRSELIWEGAYQPSALGSNGTAATNPTGQWYTSSISDLFYQNIAGSGPTYQPGTQTYVLKTLAQWTAGYSANSTVSGLSVGAGSGAGAGYHAFADNVTYYAGGNTTNYNFEAATPAVPEPATWAMMIAGFGLVGASMRRRSTKVAFAA